MGESEQESGSGEGDGCTVGETNLGGGDSRAIVEFCAEGFTPRGNPVRRTWVVSVSRQATSEMWGGGVGGTWEVGSAVGGWTEFRDRNFR